MTNKTVLVYDYGVYLNFAQRLTDFFSRVLYFNQWKSQSPKTNVHDIGIGVDGVEKVENFWVVVDEVDLFVFPDVYDGDLQLELERRGKLVWGSRKGEELELNRWEAYLLFKRLGFDSTPTRRVIGIEALKLCLKSTKDKFVKISTVRGDTETFHHEVWNTTQNKIREVEYKLGAKAAIAEFLVQDAINDAIEIGFDGWCIDGKFPKKAMMGYESKDTALVGVIKDYSDLAPDLLEFNSRLSEILRKYRFRGFWSLEARKNQQVCIPIDPCCRLGTPPSELYQMVWENWDEILLEGAKGEIVEPITSARYGLQAILVSHWSEKNWQTIVFPQSVAPFVKLKNFTVINNVLNVMPQESELVEIGSIVSTGSTLEEAWNNLQSTADQVKGYDLHPKLGAVKGAIEEIEKGEALGIDFLHPGDTIPNFETAQ